MDWLLATPALVIEIVLVNRFGRGNFISRAWTLACLSALMVVSGCCGELVITHDLNICVNFFLYIVYELLVGLAAATNCKNDPRGACYGRDQLVHVPNCVFDPNVRLVSFHGVRFTTFLQKSQFQRSDLQLIIS